MNNNSYKIISNRVPVVHLRNKVGTSQLKDITPEKKPRSSRVVSTDCFSCEYVSDGSTVIKLSELVKMLKERKEIKLYPLSLSINENTTTHHAASENEGFSSVTIHVDVEDSRDRLTPTYIIVFTPYTRRSYYFTKNKIDINEGCILIQLYPLGRNKNCLEIKINDITDDDLKEDGWYLTIPKREYGFVKKMSIFGKCREDEYLVYELESNGLQQNQKLTVLNYL